MNDDTFNTFHENFTWYNYPAATVPVTGTTWLDGWDQWGITRSEYPHYAPALFPPNSKMVLREIKGPYLLFIGIAFTVTLVWWVLGRRYEYGRCVRCSYNILYSPKRCPECGLEAKLQLPMSRGWRSDIAPRPPFRYRFIQMLRMAMWVFAVKVILFAAVNFTPLRKIVLLPMWFSELLSFPLTYSFVIGPFADVRSLLIFIIATVLNCLGLGCLLAV